MLEAAAPSADSRAGSAILEPEPLLENNPSLHSITEAICAPVELPVEKTPIGWIISFVIARGPAGLLWALRRDAVLQRRRRLGQQPAGRWAWDITNFVWWIGIGHAGTLISPSCSCSSRSGVRRFNRFAEAMTIFAVICALQFPIIHTGRPWLAVYWLLPLPNQMSMWPNFRSPLMWDVFAVSTYFTVSLLFWYVGLIPDLATLRDRAR